MDCDVEDGIVGGCGNMAGCWLRKMALSRSSVSFRRSISCLLKFCRRVASAYDVVGITLDGALTWFLASA